MNRWCNLKDRSGALSVVVVLGMLLLSGPATIAADPADPPFGLDPQISFSDHVLREYRQRDGLPSDWIHELLQTRDGFLWIGTQNGIARFDGKRFQVFNRSSTPQLPANDVRVMLEDSRGSLWIGSIGGLTRYRPGRPGRFEEIRQFSGCSVHGIHEDRNGTLWFGTSDSTWTSEDGIDFEEHPELPTAVRAFCEDTEGHLWLGSRTGLYRQAASLEKLTHPRLPDASASDNGIPSAAINDLLADRRGNIWIAANRGLFCVRDGRFVGSGAEVGRRHVSDLTETRQGDIYAATRNGIYCSADGQPFKRVFDKEIARCLLEDREGCLWAGFTVHGALRCFRRSNTQTILTDQRVRCVHEESPGRLWLGTADGLFRREQGRLLRYGEDDGLPHHGISSFSAASAGGFWIGTHGGLARWTGTEFETAPLPPELSGIHIGNTLESPPGTLWISVRGSGRGAWRVSNGVATRLTQLDHGHTRWFYQTDSLMLIGHEFGLYQFADGRLTQMTDPEFERLRSSHFLCHDVSPDGTLWMGTSGGILRYGNGQFRALTSQDGLAADYIDRIGRDHQGHLWMGGNAGYFAVPISELDELANGRRSTVVSRKAEQLPGAAVGAYHPATCLAADGTLWCTGNRGVISISPDPMPSGNVAPIVNIEEVLLDGRTLQESDATIFQSGHHRLAIHFAAPTFHDPNRAVVQYRLDGFDEKWVDAGDERIAYYTDLRPGQYLFRVRADNGDAASSSVTSPLTFEVTPRWWETFWFPPAVGLVLVGLTLAGSWRHLRTVKKRNAELRELIRQRTEAETELRGSEARFRELAESTQAIPWEADPLTLRFTFVGRQAEDILGYRVDDWLEPDFWVEHLHPKDRLEAIAFCQHAVERCMSHQFEYRMLAADGSTVWLHDVVHVVVENGVAQRLRGFMIDVTSRRVAEESAVAYQRQLTRMDRVASMGEMATSIAHEVKQPLFAIVSNAQTATRLLNHDDPDIDEIREALLDIASDGNRASDIIDRVRARVRKGDQTLEPIDVNQVAMEAVRFIVPELRRRGLQLKTEFACELPPVTGDSVELQQVILNLIINAAQAMRNSPADRRELIIRTSAWDQQVELAVEDQGHGFGSHQPSELFEPFYTGRPGGTGMGLAINRTIIEAHGGQIEALANPDGGATFRFSLPVCSELNIP